MTQVAKTPKSAIQEYTLTSSASLLGLANEMTKFIKEKQLYKKIGENYYVLVEAWTYAGVSIGLMPIVSELENIGKDNEIKYRAVVDLLNIHSGQVVGRGFAICSNKEAKKRSFDEYAIASMAQTRATGKAYRLPLGWLMKAAGYEATPAEEMDFQTAEVVESKKPSAPVEKAQPAAEAEALEAEKTTVLNVNEYATAKQKERIISLLNNEHITKQEKTQMLLNINKLTKERAETSIERLNKTIGDRAREKGDTFTPAPFKQGDPATHAQKEFINKLLMSHVITEEERQEAQIECDSFTFTVADAAGLITQLEQAIKDRKAKEKKQAQAA